MVNYVRWKWQNSRRWERRNIIWTILFILSIIIGSHTLSFITGGLLIADAFISACVNSYYNYKRCTQNKQQAWERGVNEN